MTESSSLARPLAPIPLGGPLKPDPSFGEGGYLLREYGQDIIEWVPRPIDRTGARTLIRMEVPADVFAGSVLERFASWLTFVGVASDSIERDGLDLPRIQRVRRLRLEGRSSPVTRAEYLLRWARLYGWPSYWRGEYTRHPSSVQAIQARWASYEAAISQSRP